MESGAQRRLRWEHASPSALPTAGLQFRSSGQGALGWSCCHVAMHSFKSYEFLPETKIAVKTLDPLWEDQVSNPSCKTQGLSLSANTRQTPQLHYLFSFFSSTHWVSHCSSLPPPPPSLFLLRFYYYHYYYRTHLHECLAWLELGTWCLNLKRSLLKLARVWLAQDQRVSWGAGRSVLNWSPHLWVTDVKVVGVKGLWPSAKPIETLLFFLITHSGLIYKNISDKDKASVIQLYGSLWETS